MIQERISVYRLMSRMVKCPPLTQEWKREFFFHPKANPFSSRCKTQVNILQSKLYKQVKNRIITKG